MLNEIRRFCRQEGLISPGCRVICAVSGGADSMALLWSLCLLREEFGIAALSAAHFNHGLRGEESLRDANFVQEFCRDHRIPFQLGSGDIRPGKKGMEAAARDARYHYLLSLDPDALIATAHTADDNAETMLMHLLRGTSLRGLGGIPPRRDRLIRPMLTVTRRQVLDFLDEWSLPHVEDSSNRSGRFLRNRLRNRVLPLLREENPHFSPAMTALALRLRQDSDLLDRLGRQALDSARLPGGGLSCPVLLGLEPALQSRALAFYLQEQGVREPEAVHIRAITALLYAASPSARADLPGGVRFGRQYDRLIPLPADCTPFCYPLTLPGCTFIPEAGFHIVCRFLSAGAAQPEGPDTFCLDPARIQEPLLARSRRTGDRIRLSGGSRSLKKAMIDRKIPAARRDCLPVLTCGAEIAAVCGLGPDSAYAAKPGAPALQILIQAQSIRE